MIGLAIARRLASAGLSVTVFDRSTPGREASYAAGGMLCPRLEFEKESRLSEMGEISLQLYPDYARALEEETGLCVDLRLNGVVSPLGADPGSTGINENGARIIEGHTLRDLEPGIAPEITRALYYEEEGSLDSRALTEALEAACRKLGVAIREDCEVIEVIATEDRVNGVRTPSGDFSSPVVINSAGSWASEISGAQQVEVRPIKGQMLLLDCGGNEKEIPRHTIYTHDIYLVPRADGRLIVGTTVEDKGFDKEVEPEVISDLHQSATRLFPFLGEMPVLDSWAGLRPRGEHEIPTIGPLSPEGYYAAIGHYRNGILLTPLTQELLAREILGESE